jgi:hypothetical protein
MVAYHAERPKIKKRWQNILYLKCPKCDTRMKASGIGFVCIDDQCDFFIARTKIVDILRDESHIIRRHIRPSEWPSVEGFIAEILSVRSVPIYFPPIEQDRNSTHAGPKAGFQSIDQIDKIEDYV